MQPLVSVLMTAYNSGKYIEEAIRSILNQTYHNLELIIVEDASTDATLQIIKQFSDDRIRLYCNEKNSGTLYGMQRAIALARGEYIAVLDSDDISLSKRIEKQVSFLQGHPEVLLCSTKVDYIVKGKRVKIPYTEVKSMEELRFSMFFGNEYIVHSTVMFRKSELEKRRIRYERFSYCHDYYLLLQIVAVGQIYLMDEVLGLYRIHPTQKTSVLSNHKRGKETSDAQVAYIRKLKGLSKEDKKVLCRAIRGNLRAYEEYKVFGKALRHYIGLFNLGKENRGVIKKECTNMLMKQKKCAARLFFGMTSDLIDKRVLLKKETVQ